MSNKQNKKFKQRLASAKANCEAATKVVYCREHPSMGIPKWDMPAFLRLIASKKWVACLTAMFDFMAFFETNHYKGFGAEDVTTIDNFVTSVAALLAQPDIVAEGNAAPRLVSFGHIFSNLVSISHYGTTDFLLKQLIREGNLIKLLFVQNARCEIQGRVKTFFDANIPLASLWYTTYMLGLGCPTKVQQENLHKHVTEIDERWTATGTCVSPPMFTCTYFNQADAKRAKIVMNNAVKKNCTTKFENNPDPLSIAIVTSKWHRNHAVYKSAGPLVEQLLDKYRLTLIHLGAQVPDNLVKDYFDNVYKVYFDRDGVLRVPNEVQKNDFQLVYYPDIGMIDEGVWLSNHRIAPIQAVGYGHPETTGCSEIDYMLGGDVERDCADWYTEKLVLIPGLGQHPAWPTAPRMNSWQPSDKVRINCVWGPDKYNYTMLKVLAEINKRVGSTDKHEWHFFPSPGANRYASLVPFLRDVSAIVPNNVVHSEVEYYDYMRDAELHDFAVNSYPFGGYNTVVESYYLGLPMVSLRGPRYYNRAGNELNTQIGMEELNADTVVDFINIITRMILDGEYRAAERAKLASIDLKAALFKVGPKHFLNAVDHIIAKHPLQTNPTLIGEIYGDSQ